MRPVLQLYGTYAKLGRTKGETTMLTPLEEVHQRNAVVRPTEDRRKRVAESKGELPKRSGGGKTRQPNPFDGHIAKGGTHEVTLEKGDDVEAIKRQLRAAAQFGSKSVDIFPDEPNKRVLFKVVPFKSTTYKMEESTMDLHEREEMDFDRNRMFDAIEDNEPF